MRIIPLSSIVIRKRQRTKHAPEHIRDLAGSIRKTCLIHAPTVFFDGLTPILVAGEGRVKAIQLLQEEAIGGFRYGEEWINKGDCPVISLMDELSLADRVQVELDENLRRENLPWPDRSQALSALHALRVAENPGQTLTDTGRELVEKGASKSVASAAQQVRQATIVSARLDDPRIANARSEGEAMALILRETEDRASAAIARRVQKSTSLTCEIHHGDCYKFLPTLPSSTFSLLCTDPPYGIEADSGGFRSRTVLHHTYDDSLENARKLLQFILREGFRVTTPHAAAFLFIHMKNWEWICVTAAQLGWSHFEVPLIWQKSKSEGLAPWGSAGPRRTYDAIFLAVKGQRGLISSPTDICDFPRVSRADRTYAAEKPVPLMSHLVRCGSMPGESVLDPCCGSGATIVACRDLNRRGVGIELDKRTSNTALANLHRDWKDIEYASGLTVPSAPGQIDVASSPNQPSEAGRV